MTESLHLSSFEPTPDIALQKNRIRKHIRTVRKNLTPAQQAQAANQLSKHILTRVKQSNAKKVALFFSMDGEIGTKQAIEALWQAGIEVYLPIIHPFSTVHLLFVRFEQHTKLFRSPLGMLEPKAQCHKICPLAKLDIVFTPLVAFDCNGHRLGMGGGFYDRTLARLPTLRQPPMVIGLAHACQQVDAVPVESWDMPLKEIITDQSAHQF